MAHVVPRFLLVLLLAWSGLATAEAPLQKTQVPGYYRLMVGKIEVTALYDGPVSLDTKLLKNTTQAQAQRLLAHMFLQGPAVQTAVNAYLLNTGDKLILVDAGAAGLFGPSLGKVAANLRAAGFEPAQVDAVLLTHLHGDHVNGLLDAEGKPLFPKAEIWAAKAEAEFWLSPEVAAMAPQEAQPFFQMAQNATTPYREAGRFKTFGDDQELAPGIRSVAAGGHTPGHSAYLVSSGDARLLIWGDIVHNHAVQFRRPEVAIEFDVDAKQAVLTRKALFKRVAKEKLLVAGMHLPFPGIGHVRAEPRGYAWVPIEFGPVQE
ncbi:MAG: MBL fold metallo-hydrolase [Rhodocyclaceae bacterium]|jgi:glyoxylase-like metal-dependent hydrolase (beta-lactamase superfamily II)|nr:MBL fold metallo-hydrolase [Rhodocyclaceae bacterium]